MPHLIPLVQMVLEGTTLPLPPIAGIPVLISIPDNSAVGTDGNTQTGGTSLRFHQSPTITAEDSLVLWYNFEENDTNRVLDLSNRYTDGNLYGGQRVAGKFSQSLQLLPSESIQISGDDFPLIKPLPSLCGQRFWMIVGIILKMVKYTSNIVMISNLWINLQW